jgi:hypothetical protein
VLVTAVAGVAEQALRVARLAGAHSGLSVIEGKGMGAIEAGRRPGGAVVASSAITAKQPKVVSRLSVAGGALLRCPAKDPVFMAVRT